MLVHTAVINYTLLLAQSFINHLPALKTGSLLSSYSLLLKMASPLKNYKDNSVISLGATVDAISQTIELKAQFNEKYDSLIPGMSGIVKF